MAQSRVTLIFNLSTTPSNLAVASVHTGGWSESYWQSGVINSADPKIFDIVSARAGMLPTTAAITGFRIGNYTLLGNRIVPGGASTGALRRVGNVLWRCDIPSNGLGLVATSLGGPNSSRTIARALPDQFCAGGEYNPDGDYINAVQAFIDRLTNAPWYFVGRDLSQPIRTVVSINTSVLQTGDANVFNVGDYVRMHKVYQTSKLPLKGAFRVLSIDVTGKLYTLQIDPSIIVSNSGFCRKDLLATFKIDAVVPSRVRQRKVGRPSEGYRGRASRRR